jgi:propanol-preferring alcohol dehydrogenase
MKAMVLSTPKSPLVWTELPDRHPGPGQIRVKVLACGVCRTDLHVLDGELPHPRSPIIPGHEIVGRIDEIGDGVKGLMLADRVGIPWLGHTCGVCPYCRGNRENLCDAPLFTGYTRDGGFASSTIADARFAFPLGETGTDVSLAPLLCAGLIGWRSLAIAGDGKTIGLYGYGAAGHIVAQVARWQERRVFAFTRPGDTATQAFARSLGAVWAGGSDEAESGAKGRARRLRRHPYERHPPLSLRKSLGGAAARVSRQPDAAGRDRFSPAGARDGPADQNDDLPVARGERGSGGPPRRSVRGRGGAGAVNSCR